MKRDDLYDLAAFAVVAERGSFTRAAAELRISQSALSHAIKALEERLGVRLLADHALGVDNRSRRDAAALPAPRASGDRLRPGRGRRLAREAVRHRLRLTATKHAVSSVVMPVLPGFLASNPDIRVEMLVDDNLTDIVANRIDAGIRFGDLVEKDMIAIRIGPDVRMAVVGAPSYFAGRRVPGRPASFQASAASTTGRSDQVGSTPGTSKRGGRPFAVRVEGPLVFNNSDLIREAALAGQGLAYVYENEVGSRPG